MSEDNLNDDFLKLGDMSDIDDRILQGAGEEDLVGRLSQEQEKQAEERSPLIREVKRRWFSYTLLSLSFLLTEMTALYLGLAPEIRTDPETGFKSVYFHTDVGHLATALIYMIVLPVVTELAFAVFSHRFNKRENGNGKQLFASGLASAIALIAIIGTGVSGAYVIFSTLGSVGFLEIPRSVQNWLIWVIPSLIAIFGALLWMYEASSGIAKSEKIAEERDRKDEINDRLRTQEITRAGRRAIKAASIRAYQKAVINGLLSQEEALDGLARGKSLVELEKELRRDLTGEGRIGEGRGLAQARKALPERKILPAPKSREYTLEEILRFMDTTPEKAIDLIREYELLDAMKAYKALSENGYLPEDLREGNFMEAYCKLLGVAPTWGPVQLPDF
jgi:hypothetical protein